MPSLAPTQTAVAPRATTFTLAGVDVWRPDAGRLSGVDVSVSGGAITGIEAGAAPGEYAGCVVTPGLIDGHLHLPPDNALRLSGLYALLLLVHGVTAVRDAGDGEGTAISAFRAGAERETFPAPRVVACGPYVARAPAAWANTVLVDDALDPRDAVASARRRGAQMVKLYDGLTRADIAGLEAAATDAGLGTIGHLPAGLDYVTAGVRHVQHFHGVPRPGSASASLFDRLADWRSVDADRLDAVVGATVGQGIRNTPTLVVGQGVLRAQSGDDADAADARLLPDFFAEVVWDRRHGLAAYRGLSTGAIAMLRDSQERKLELLGRLHEAGAELFLGTDVGQPYVVPGAGLHHEMRLWTQAGIDPEAVWRRGTAAAGRELPPPGGAGTVAVGAPADLLVFDRDPTRDLDALDSLRAVVSDGRLYDAGDLRAAVDRTLEHYRSPVVRRIAHLAARRTMRRLAGSVR